MLSRKLASQVRRAEAERDAYRELALLYCCCDKRSVPHGVLALSCAERCAHARERGDYCAEVLEEVDGDDDLPVQRDAGQR